MKQQATTALLIVGGVAVLAYLWYSRTQQTSPSSPVQQQAQTSTDDNGCGCP